MQTMVGVGLGYAFEKFTKVEMSVCIERDYVNTGLP